MARSRNSTPGATASSFIQIPYQLLGRETRRPRASGPAFLRRAVVAILIVFTTLYFLAPNSSSKSKPKSNRTNSSKTKSLRNINSNNNDNDNDGSQIKTSTTSSPPGHDYCPLPNISISSPELTSILSRSGVSITPCSDKYMTFSEYVYEDESSRIILINSITEAGYDDCCVYEVSRPKVMKSDSYILSGCKPFNSPGPGGIYKIKLSSTIEFFITKCRHISSNTSKFNYHPRVVPTAGTIGSKVKHWESKSKDDNLPVNVLILVLDSTTRLDAHRQLPKTMKFLLESMDFIEFNKYTVLGEPTMENAIPLLLGQKTKEFFKSHNWDDYWDSSNFIWKAFNNSGYVTGYTEDIPALGTFNYGGQIGFLEPPTDVYMRPFFMAREDLSTSYNYNTVRTYFGSTFDMCLGPKNYWNIIYDYHFELINKLNSRAPLFLIPWLCWPFHDYFGSLGRLDLDTLNFFQKIQDEPKILDNTVLIVLGDHGFYASEYSNTWAGLLERRLPLFMIRLPENLIKHNPELVSIVKSNSKTVTTHYDVYQTLLELSDWKNQAQGGNRSHTLGQSIFKLLPKNRTCEEANIPNTWCPCELPSPPIKTSKNKSMSIPEDVKIHKESSYKRIMNQHPMAKSTFLIVNHYEKKCSFKKISTVLKNVKSCVLKCFR